MELSSLKIFVAVAETGGVSSAAQRANCVQSNVTARIKKLEEELGVALFLRQSKGMILTTQGEVLLDYAYKMLDMERRALHEIGASLEDGGQLTLGAMESAMAVRLPAILKEFHRLQPKTTLTVRTGTTDEMIDNILKHQLDCAVVGSYVDHDDIVSVPFFKERLVLVSAKDHEKLNTLLVYRRGCVYRARAENWLRQTGRLPYSIMEFGTQEGIIGCVGAGLGITLMPHEVVKNLTQDVVTSELPDEIALVQTYLIYRKEVLRTKPMETLLGLVSTNLQAEVA